MPSITFVIDESGAKGFSNNPESLVGELGVFAGFLLPNEYVDEVKAELGSISDKYLVDGKLHITDLKSNDQETLRREFFDYIRSRNIRWTYEATYVQGYYDHAQIISDIIKKAKDENTSRIKSSSRENRDRLHSELFLGAFGKGVAFCKDYIGEDFHLNIITDRVDKPILKDFEKKAQELFKVGEKKVHESTGFDPDTKEIVRAAISTEVTDGKELLGDYSGVTFDINIDDSPLTLAADILANSVRYHLASLQEASPGHALNSEEAIKGHLLASLVYGVTTPETMSPQISDTMFRHPAIDNRNQK